MKYIFLLFGEEEAWARMSEAERNEIMASHMAFAEALAEAGKEVAGEELAPGHTATTLRVGRSTEVTDGPFVETKEQLGGYYVFDCEDLDEALAWARRIPMTGGAVEIRPVVEDPSAS
jgi:hypothetical protein